MLNKKLFITLIYLFEKETEWEGQKLQTIWKFGDKSISSWWTSIYLGNFLGKIKILNAKKIESEIVEFYFFWNLWLGERSERSIERMLPLSCFIQISM